MKNLAGVYSIRAGRQGGTALPAQPQNLEERLGPDHPAMAESLNNLAEIYRNVGRYAQAEPLYKRSLKIESPNSGRTIPTWDRA